MKSHHRLGFKFTFIKRNKILLLLINLIINWSALPKVEVILGWKLKTFHAIVILYTAIPCSIAKLWLCLVVGYNNIQFYYNSRINLEHIIWIYWFIVSLLLIKINYYKLLTWPASKCNLYAWKIKKKYFIWKLKRESYYFTNKIKI